MKLSIKGCPFCHAMPEVLIDRHNQVCIKCMKHPELVAVRGEILEEVSDVVTSWNLEDWILMGASESMMAGRPTYTLDSEKINREKLISPEEKYVFIKTLVEDRPTEVGRKYLDELFSYIREHLGGLKTLYFWSYRLDDIQCFAVDLKGINGKDCSITIGVTHRLCWDMLSHTIDIEVADGTDVLGIVQYLIGTFNLSTVREERDHGVLVFDFLGKQGEC